MKEEELLFVTIANDKDMQEKVNITKYAKGQCKINIKNLPKDIQEDLCKSVLYF